MFVDRVLRTWPGAYSLRSLGDEDARDLFLTLDLLDPDLGKADDGE